MTATTVALRMLNVFQPDYNTAVVTVAERTEDKRLWRVDVYCCQRERCGWTWTSSNILTQEAEKLSLSLSQAIVPYTYEAARNFVLDYLRQHCPAK